MTSDHVYKETFAWIWLPGETEPVVAGVLTQVGQKLHFNYGKSYLEREKGPAPRKEVVWLLRSADPSQQAGEDTFERLSVADSSLYESRLCRSG